MRKYVIMGVQGSGKGTQAALLAAGLDLVHISVGDIFRWNVQQHTKLGAQVRRTMVAGELVADEMVESVVRERLSQHDWNYGFIIDGFPRNRPQAGCGMDYNLIADSPHTAGKCDACGGELVTREDDTEEALAVRVRDYHEKTNPVLDVFRRKEYVVTVDATPERELVQQAIRNALALPPYQP